MLTDAQVERYSRQIILPEVGARGQERLLASRIAVAGDGEAAITAALLLGRAGVGELDVDERIGTLPEVAPECRVSRATTDGVDGVDVLVVLTGEEPPPDTGVSGILWSNEPRTPVVFGMLARRLVVATLLWRSCLACFPDTWPLHDAELPPEASPAARTMLGALAANEALRVLLTAPTKSRLTILDVAQGTAVVKEVEPVGCPFCKALA
jgi:hypothetical protein